MDPARESQRRALVAVSLTENSLLCVWPCSPRLGSACADEPVQVKLGTTLLLNALPLDAQSLLSRGLALEHPTACGTKEADLSNPSHC